MDVLISITGTQLVDGERDTIKQVIRESMVRGWEMTEIRSEKSSMEAVFAKLSGK